MRAKEMYVSSLVERRAPRPFLGAVAGAVGGILGSWMMVQFNHLVGGIEENQQRTSHRRESASPNEHDGTISDEPASLKVASLASEKITGEPLSERGKEIAGPVFHYGFGAVAGAVYGLTAEFNPDATAAAGLPFGAAVWLIADEAALPLTGLSAPPTEYPLSRHASALGTHLVFGLTVEAVRRAVRGRRATSYRRG